MSSETMLGTAGEVTLEEALAGSPEPPPLESEYTALLVGVLRPDTASDSVRLYPPSGCEESYYLIKKADVDTERVELIRPEAAAARGWFAERVVRLRVRPSAEVLAVSARVIEARELSDEVRPHAVPICNGTKCTQGYICTVGSGGQNVCRKAGFPDVACPTCIGG